MSQSDNHYEIIEPGRYELNNGRRLHIWVSGTEDEPKMWACTAYDHGPFCRLCQEVDHLLNFCLINVIDGRFDCDQEPDGEFLFRLTKAGEHAARATIERTANE